MVNDKAIEPHVPVWDKTHAVDDTLFSNDFQWDEQGDEYRCRKAARCGSQWRPFELPRTHVTKPTRSSTRSSNPIVRGCPMKARCCPNTPYPQGSLAAFYEPARDVASCHRQDRHKQSRKDRKKVEMLFAHLKRIMRLDRLRLRGPSGAHVMSSCSPPAAQNFRRWRKRLCPPAPVPALGGT